MKTIAVSIDDGTLQALAKITRTEARGRGGRGGAAKAPNRSALVRKALHEFVERRERSQREAKEQLAIARHRDLLERQAAALVAEQADP